MAEGEISEKEARIRAITKLYYSYPKVQEVLINFSPGREVVPRYFEGFGRRPDILQYPSDILGMVNRGATSFHSSEEIWDDPLKLSSDSTQDQMNDLRKSWDLLVDIDSPYLDLTKIAAQLLVKALDQHGIKNYGIKFSGSKGFHVIVSGEAFPEEYDGKKRSRSFPEWPRAITEYLMSFIREDYDIEVGKIANLSGSDDTKRIVCMKCNKPAIEGESVRFQCPVCNLEISRMDIKLTKRRLRCLNKNCPGVFDVIETKKYLFCENCKDPENDKFHLNYGKNPEAFKEKRGEDAEKHSKFDLVLVAPRHLFRMPYSLHEKTSLASVVLYKDEIANFTPRDANPMNMKIREFYPKNEPGEARRLLTEALEWKKNHTAQEEKFIEEKYKNMEYTPTDFSGVQESMFPDPIKKILLGLKDGKKRGMFVLITFLRTLNFSPEYINNRLREWNKLNEPPLKEGYIKSQIDWHLKQKKKILPPNYTNEAFYKDLGVLDKKPDAKNPIVEVARRLRRNY